MISWAAAIGTKWPKPSSATQEPGLTKRATAAAKVLSLSLLTPQAVAPVVACSLRATYIRSFPNSPAAASITRSAESGEYRAIPTS